MPLPQVVILGGGAAAGAAAAALQGHVRQLTLSVVVLIPTSEQPPVFAHEQVLSQGYSQTNIPIDWSNLRPVVSEVVRADVYDILADVKVIVTPTRRICYDALVVCHTSGRAQLSGTVMDDMYSVDIASVHDVIALPSAVDTALRRHAKESAVGGDPSVTFVVPRPAAAGFADAYAADCEERECVVHPLCYLSLCYSTLTRLDLGGFMLDAASLAAATAALAKSITIRWVSLKGCGVQDEGAGAALSVLLKGSAPLHELNVSDNSLGPGGVANLVHGLSDSKTLSILHIDNNNLGEQGGHALADSVEASTVTHLYASRNGITAGGAVPLWKQLSRVEYLDVSCNDIKMEEGDAAAVVLKEYLCGKRHRSLVLSGNPLGRPGAAIISEALREGAATSGLQKLLCEGCFEPLEVQYVLDSAQRHRTLSALDLRSKTPMGHQGAIRVGAFFEQNMSLKSLSVTMHGLTHGTLVAEGMKNNNTVVEFNAWPDSESPPGSPHEHVLRVLERNNTAKNHDVEQPEPSFLPTPFHFVPLLCGLVDERAEKLGVPCPRVRVVAEGFTQGVEEWLRSAVLAEVNGNVKVSCHFVPGPVERGTYDGLLRIRDETLSHCLLVSAADSPLHPAVLDMATRCGLRLTDTRKLMVDGNQRVLTEERPKSGGCGVYAAGLSCAESGALSVCGFTQTHPCGVQHAVRQGFAAGHNAGLHALSRRGVGSPDATSGESGGREVKEPAWLSARVGCTMTDTALGPLKALSDAAGTPLMAAWDVMRLLFRPNELKLEPFAEYLARFRVPHMADWLLSRLLVEPPVFCGSTPADVSATRKADDAAAAAGSPQQKGRGKGRGTQRKSHSEGLSEAVHFAATTPVQCPEGPRDVADWFSTKLTEFERACLLCPALEIVCSADASSA